MPIGSMIDLEKLLERSRHLYSWIGDYKYDFARMLQENIRTGKTRHIRRIAGDLTISG